MDHLIFDAETKATTIDLETLDRTLKIEDAGGGLPAAAPIEHVNLIKLLLFMAAEKLTKYHAFLEPIIIKQNNCKRIQWKGEPSECPIENFLIERLVARILFRPNMEEDAGGVFSGIEDTEGDMAVAISYNERGIQLAFGHNVWTCQNLNVFGQNVRTTYGDNKADYSEVISDYENWLIDFEVIKQLNDDNIRLLRNYPLLVSQRQEWIGELFELAVFKNENVDNISAPLNVTECGKLIKASIERVWETDRTESITAWEFTNWGTSVLRAETSDGVNLLTKNAAFNAFVLNKVQG